MHPPIKLALNRSVRWVDVCINFDGMKNQPEETLDLLMQYCELRTEESICGSSLAHIQVYPTRLASTRPPLPQWSSRPPSASRMI